MKPLKTGTVTITATTKRGKKSAKVKVKITDPTLPKAVKINPLASTTLWKGAQLTLTATLTASTAGVAPVSTLTWKSSNTKIVAIDKSTGALTAKKPGKATITVTTRNKKTAKLKLTVIDPNAPTGVTIAQGTAATLSLSGSKTLQLTATAQCPSGTPSTTYKWTSSNKKIATVSKTGLVTAKKAGKVKITVTTANKKKATITVTVTK